MSQLVSRNVLQSLLEKEIVNFEFIKTNGENRKVYGTLNNDYIPANLQPRTSGSKGKTLPYFDIESQSWKSMSGNSNFMLISSFTPDSKND